MCGSKVDLDDGSQYGWVAKPMPRIDTRMKAEIIRRGAGVAVADLRAASPIPLDWPRDEDGWRALSHLYGPDDYLFLGTDITSGVHGESILPAGEWIDVLKAGKGGCPHPMFVPNPLFNLPGFIAADQPANRSETCIADRRFMVCELACAPIEHHVALWGALPHLPVAAITYDGKDALNVLVRVDATGENEWRRELVNTLAEKFLLPLGIGASCKLASTTARMPGHRRPDTDQWQRLLYLAAAGMAVAHAP